MNRAAENRALKFIAGPFAYTPYTFYSNLSGITNLNEPRSWDFFLCYPAHLNIFSIYHNDAFWFQVLQELKYIDSSKTVQLKGRVACEMSNHELIITELVFENALTKLHPTGTDRPSDDHVNDKFSFSCFVKS